MKLWKIHWCDGFSLGLAIVRASTEDQAFVMAHEYAEKEGLRTDWIDRSAVQECSEAAGVIAWAES